PIGGLKEKTLAAKRAGIRTIIIPKQNEKDLDDIPKNVRKEMKFILADTLDEVISSALRKKGSAPVTRKKLPGRSGAMH
ncbi:MAG TPA: hypothetical protein DCO77_03915, partial [Nitrospiraceae bacterium]|nr:hypothetical protein [Nitrospiraceae bacterium]